MWKLFNTQLYRSIVTPIELTFSIYTSLQVARSSILLSLFLQCLMNYQELRNNGKYFVEEIAQAATGGIYIDYLPTFSNGILQRSEY